MTWFSDMAASSIHEWRDVLELHRLRRSPCVSICERVESFGCFRKIRPEPAWDFSFSPWGITFTSLKSRKMYECSVYAISTCLILKPDYTVSSLVNITSIPFSYKETSVTKQTEPIKKPNQLWISIRQTSKPSISSQQRAGKNIKINYRQWIHQRKRSEQWWIHICEWFDWGISRDWSLGQLCYCPLDCRNSIHELCPEKNIGIVEHSFLQRNHDKLLKNEVSEAETVLRPNIGFKVDNIWLSKGLRWRFDLWVREMSFYHSSYVLCVAEIKSCINLTNTKSWMFLFFHLLRNLKLKK